MKHQNSHFKSTASQGFTRMNQLLWLLGFGLMSTSCGNVLLNMTSQKEGAQSFKLDDASALNDTLTRCGGSIAELSNQKASFFKQDFVSSKIVVTGKRRDIEYSVFVEAKVQVESKGGFSSSDVSAQVIDITAQSVGSSNSQSTTPVPLNKAAIDQLIRPEAETSTAKKNSKSKNQSVPSFDLLKYNKDGSGQYANIFCAVGLTQSSDTVKSIGRLRLDYSMPIPLSLNPKASVATYNSELSTSRSFTVAATILEGTSESPAAGSVVNITVTWTKVNPSLQEILKGSTVSEIPNVTADVAYEVKIAVSGGGITSPEQIGLTKRRVYLVDTRLKRFAAIVEDASQDPTNTEVVPPTILVGQ